MPEARSTWKVAHRGWHRDHLENTLEAFRAAYAAGCDMVEFDVQLSRDGVPVIFHDDDCRRLAGRPEAVHDLDWAALREIRMPGKGEARHAIPSLEEFLAEFGGKPFYLELKIPHAKGEDPAYYESLGRQAAEMVRRAGPHRHTFLASFHPAILRYLHREALYPVLAGIFENYDRFRAVHAGRDVETAAAVRYYSISWGLFRRFLKEGDGAGAGKPGPSGRPGLHQLLIWDIGGESRFHTALKQGVLGVVADDVEGMLRAKL